MLYYNYAIKRSILLSDFVHQVRIVRHLQRVTHQALFTRAIWSMLAAIKKKSQNWDDLHAKTKEILRVTFSSPALLRQLKTPRGDSQCSVWGRKPAARGLSCWRKAEHSLNQSINLTVSLKQPQSWPITPKHSPLARPLFLSSSHIKASGLVCSASLFQVSDCKYIHLSGTIQ